MGEERRIPRNPPSEDEVSDVDDDFDYLPDEQRPQPGARVPSYPYAGPPRTGSTGPTGPQPRLNGTGPQPRLNGTGPQPRLNGPANGTYANGTYARTNGNGRPAPRYQQT